MPRARHRGAIRAVPDAAQPDIAQLVREYHVKMTAAKKVVGDARVEVASLFSEIENTHHIHKPAFAEASKRARQYGQHPAAALEHIERVFQYYIALGMVSENANIAFNQGNLFKHKLKEAIA
jgi:hypothetical protein